MIYISTIYHIYVFLHLYNACSKNYNHFICLIAFGISSLLLLYLALSTYLILSLQLNILFSDYCFIFLWLPLVSLCTHYFSSYITYSTYYIYYTIYMMNEYYWILYIQYILHEGGLTKYIYSCSGTLAKATEPCLFYCPYIQIHVWIHNSQQL